ncbi:hypothetical protein CC78DRAFT_582055 [Lojkania enalia]|uniref:Thioester reductase (TE) domain-containing protein n=1 Tax=Lojkania enalia TaxID=147567 RepID=A0A9P4N230_9PLEO|nr:hypothetical protein CC78DRAFT_582055 [Didymosphaeria enalia]
MPSHYGPNFSLISIPEMGADNAFEEAVKGVDSIAHIASAVVFKTNPQNVIPLMIKSVVSMLEAAKKEPSVKSVIYTSSQAATTMDVTSKLHITADTWNEECRAKWTLPPSQDLKRMLMNYCSSKTDAEKASWKWIKDNVVRGESCLREGDEELNWLIEDGQQTIFIYIRKGISADMQRDLISCDGIQYNLQQDNLLPYGSRKSYSVDSPNPYHR